MREQENKYTLDVTYLLGPIFASGRSGQASGAHRHQASGTPSTSLAQRFRRGIMKNNLPLAKRVAAKAIALNQAPVASQPPASSSIHMQDSRRPSSQTLRYGDAQASEEAHLSTSNVPKSLLPLHLLVRAKYLPETTTETELPVRQRALVRQKALAAGLFDIRNIDYNAPLGSIERKSSLTLAIESGADAAMIQWLLDMGHEAEEPTRDADNNTIITVAALQNRPDVIELYCSHPTVEMVDLLNWSNNSLGQTALHLASVKGHEEVIRLLLDLGAEIDLPDREGNTALHFASAWGHLTVVKLLIERHCAFAVKNSAGFTAADFAYSHSVKAALEAFGRGQLEMKRRRRRAASSNNSGASAEDGTLSHFRGQHAYSGSPQVGESSALHEDDDMEEMGGYIVGGNQQSRSTTMPELPSKAERLLGTSLPPINQSNASSSGPPLFFPSPRPGARSNSSTDSTSLPRPQFSPFPLTPNTRQTEPSPPTKSESLFREDSQSSASTMLPSMSTTSSMGSIANRVMLQDQAAISSFLNRAKQSPGPNKRR